MSHRCSAENYLAKLYRRLRRALPITRQRMEWERVSCIVTSFEESILNRAQVEGYTLGADLAKSRT